jgi:threonine dehydrogenase-like Zn-dependent dehydrogenase
MEAHGHGVQYGYDKVKQLMKLETDRPIALREAIIACRTGGTVSVPGVYGGFVDKFPIGAWMQKGLTMKTGQTHVHRYMRPLLERIERGELDPTAIITHRLSLDEAPRGYDMFLHKDEGCVKCVMKT